MKETGIHQQILQCFYEKIGGLTRGEIKQKIPRIKRGSNLTTYLKDLIDRGHLYLDEKGEKYTAFAGNEFLEAALNAKVKNPENPKDPENAKIKNPDKELGLYSLYKDCIFQNYPEKSLKIPPTLFESKKTSKHDLLYLACIYLLNSKKSEFKKMDLLDRDCLKASEKKLDRWLRELSKEGFIKSDSQEPPTYSLVELEYLYQALIPVKECYNAYRAHFPSLPEFNLKPKCDEESEEESAEEFNAKPSKKNNFKFFSIESPKSKKQKIENPNSRLVESTAQFGRNCYWGEPKTTSALGNPTAKYILPIYAQVSLLEQGLIDVPILECAADGKILPNEQQQGTTSLMLVCKLGKLMDVVYLLSKGANPNRKEYLSGKTPLFYALVGEAMEDQKVLIVRSLLQCQATVDETLLRICVDRDLAECAKTLLNFQYSQPQQALAALFAPDGEGITAFVAAVKQGKVKLLKLFLEKIHLNNDKDNNKLRKIFLYEVNEKQPLLSALQETPVTLLPDIIEELNKYDFMEEPDFARKVKELLRPENALDSQDTESDTSDLEANEQSKMTL